MWLHAIKFNWLLLFFVLALFLVSSPALSHSLAPRSLSSAASVSLASVLLQPIRGCLNRQAQTHRHARWIRVQCSVTLQINSREAGNNSFVKQVSMESWIMCLLCKMENFFDVAAIIIVCVFLLRCTSSCTQHVSPFECRCVDPILCCFFLLYVRARSSHLVLCHYFSFNSTLFVTTTATPTIHNRPVGGRGSGRMGIVSLDRAQCWNH